MADVILASHLELITPSVMEHAGISAWSSCRSSASTRSTFRRRRAWACWSPTAPTPENFVAVAEATIGLLLMLLKRVKRSESRLRGGEWARREDRGEFLFGKTVGIVGLGRIGSHVARRLAGWDVRLLATDPYVPAERAAARGGDARRSADAARRVRHRHPPRLPHRGDARDHRREGAAGR